MDHHLGGTSFEHDEFEEIPGTIQPCDEVPRRIVAKFNPGDRVLIGVNDVVVCNGVTPSGRVDLHTR